MGYIAYFDSGTSNSRIYILDEELKVKYSDKENIGSKDSAIAGGNDILLKGLYELFRKALTSLGSAEEDIQSIYMSGMVTSPYGVHEVPHALLPVTPGDFAENLYKHFEDKYFCREVILVPGLKKADEDFTFVGNMRGEEIEIIGTLDELEKMGLDKVALMMPGSHTHTAFIELRPGKELSLKSDTPLNGDPQPVIKDILSQFTGEVFHALKEETVLAPILSTDASASDLDPEMIRMALTNLEKFGFNRSMYICHAMRIMEACTPQQRFAYGEGVIMGGMKAAVEEYCRTRWEGCHTLAVVCDDFMFRLISLIFEDSKIIDNVIHLPISADKSYGVAGLRKLIRK